MNLLPVATPSAPATSGGAEDPATTGSGDFTALLAMLVGAASTTLPTDTPPNLSGDTAGADDLSLLGSLTPVPGVDLPAPELALPAPFDRSTPPVEKTIAAPIAEVPDSPPAATDGPLASLLRNAAEPSAPAIETARRRVDPRSAQPAAPAVPAQEGHSAIPAVSAVSAPPSQPQPAQFQPAQFQPMQGARPRAAEVASPPADADGALPGLEGTGAPTVPAPAAGERDRRSETLTLPEAARFDRPPLGEPPLPKPDTDHGADGRPPTVATVSPFERPPVDVPAADHADAFPAPKAAERPAAPAAPPGAATQVAPLVAANRSNTLAPVDEAPAAPAAPVTVPEQIVSAVVPLHGRGDGRHEVTLELRPDNLGTIRVEVAVEQQTVHLTLQAAEPATSRLLTANLADLRAALADAGLTAGQVGVGLDSSGGGRRRSRPQPESEPSLRDTGRATATATIASVRTLRLAAAGRLDLLL